MINHGYRMLDPLFDLHLWDSIDSNTRLERVLELAHQLSPPWQFIGISHQALGDQQHACAYFQWHGRRFVLIPGASAILGYDRTRTLRPHQFYERRARFSSIGEYNEEPDFPDLDSYLKQFDVSHSKKRLSPLREVVIAPFLLEEHANGDRRHEPVAHHVITEELAREGFRLPSSDEWEYAAAAGTRALFRWGDTCPRDTYPISKGSDDPDSTPDDLHVRPNAFGLIYSPNPYHWEVCAEANILRGGDGGSSICGGYGTFAAWLSLAPAYRVEWTHPLIFDGGIRRALSLPQV
jgi:hypothetical protein